MIASSLGFRLISNVQAPCKSAKSGNDMVYVIFQQFIVDMKRSFQVTFFINDLQHANYLFLGLFQSPICEFFANGDFSCYDTVPKHK